MTTEFLVIAGCLGIEIERCWKRLFEGQWYFLKLRFVKAGGALFKEDSWFFGLKHSVFWCVIDHPEPSAFSNARIGGCKMNLFQEASGLCRIVWTSRLFPFSFPLTAL